jgi:repressor LexA
VNTAPKEATPRQMQVLTCVRAFVAMHGYPPTLREIGDAIGITSTNGVVEHLRALARKGYIRRNKGARAIQVLR